MLVGALSARTLAAVSSQELGPKKNSMPWPHPVPCGLITAGREPGVASHCCTAHTSSSRVCARLRVMGIGKELLRVMAIAECPRPIAANMLLSAGRTETCHTVLSPWSHRCLFTLRPHLKWMEGAMQSKRPPLPAPLPKNWLYSS